MTMLVKSTAQQGFVPAGPAKRCKQFWLGSPRTRAAVLALFASAMLSFIDNFVGSVAEEAAIWQFQVLRTLIAIPLLVVIGSIPAKACGPLIFTKPRCAAGVMLVRHAGSFKLVGISAP
ncbi:hypothetical protein GA830_06045 [Mesorhizobium sp. NBSH29]|uniref:hypothetical protein n=1 Tax=Mesorhizobium sp. NBSH29 TaxID=2654249 RepID=UPI0018964A68|nr:hypothetical protein [Mesorhizobium sp. NBSH29]QPC86346.1 hypothetical protein GA830_06045 [Mesorhizobium sp. NBSH29]